MAASDETLKLKASLELFIRNKDLKKVQQAEKQMNKYNAALERVDKTGKLSKSSVLSKDFKAAGLAVDKQGQVTDRITKKSIDRDEAVARASKKTAGRIVNDKARIRKADISASVAADRGATQQAKSFEKARKSAEGNLKKTKAGVLDFSRAMGALSFLFLGQQIAASMQRIVTTTSAAYTSIVKGQTKASQSITALAANFEFLRFTVGQAIGTALSEMLPTLIPIINAITEWVSLNPKLAAGALIWTGIVATATLFAAQLVLLLAGTKNLFFGKTGLIKGIKQTITKLGGLTGALAAISVIAGVALIIEGFSTDTEGFSISDVQQVVGAGLVGAGVGFFIGGPAGAFLGFGIGTGIALIAKGFQWVKEGTINKTDLVLALIGGLALGALGFILSPPGFKAAGALLGFSIGTGIILAIQGIKFEKEAQVAKEIELTKKALEGQGAVFELPFDADATSIINSIGKVGETFKATQDNFIGPVQIEMTEFEDNLNTSIETTATNIGTVNTTANTFVNDGGANIISTNDSIAISANSAATAENNLASSIRNVNAAKSESAARTPITGDVTEFLQSNGGI